MFGKLRLLYNITSANPCSRKICATNANLYPRNLKNLKNKIENEREDANTISRIENEIETLNEVEANLFENSKNMYKPVKMQEIPSYKYKKDHSKKKDQRVAETVQKVTKKQSSSRVVEDVKLGLAYTRLELNHPLLNKIFMTVRSKKHRDKKELILIEGRRLFLEAIECGLSLQTVLFSQKEQIALLGNDIIKKISKVGEIYKVPQHDLKTWSALTTPPGIIGIFNRPTDQTITSNLENKYIRKVKHLPITIICDNIREPSNLGSIIRTAAALPCLEVIILKGCCDPWESKALRGGCGGQFRISLKYGMTWENYVKEIPKAANIFISENNLARVHEFGFDKKIQIYSEMQTKEDSYFFFVIGGETHGVSDDVYNSISENNLNAVFLHIPLANEIDSLNASSALTLLLFEARRKYLQNLSTRVDQEELDILEKIHE
ncbi:rRNA methyltransferase 3, mitochondrial isoform X2 [Condylostylus longicornis]|uniref:rRNA methyltransferase 3, mitochondrial isoform X2 n=1 Tax=Condylostylus longicornis TaxID=2530218 RepID=UPI00244E34E8|nr:rRNA methyltransferase 3, mitochondrial isoform X2 [Condylostylus longicornis]